MHELAFVLAYYKMWNGLQNGLIPRTHWKWKYALISCWNDHFAHCPSTWTLPATTTQSYSGWSKLAVILKQPTIYFWGLTVWVSCLCELLLPACRDRVLGWSDIYFSSKQFVPSWKVRVLHGIASWTSTTKSRELAWSLHTKSRTESLGSKLKLSFGPGFHQDIFSSSLGTKDHHLLSP